MARLITRRAVVSGLAGSAGLLASTGVYALGLEPGFRLRVQPYALSPPRWPEGVTLRIAALADIHAGEPYMTLSRIEEIVDATNALRPDLVVLLGDYPASHPFLTAAVPMPEVAKILSGLRGRHGVFAILGNHDWWEDPQTQAVRGGTPRIRRHFEAQNLPVLDNDAVRLTVDGHPVWLLGLGDQLAFRRLGRGVDDLAGTVAKVGDEGPAILLAHEPDIFPKVPSRISLTLSGHTHGGQVRAFGYSPLVPSRYGNRYAYGHVVEDGRHLIVSGGLGTSKVPVRLGVPPEIVLIELGSQSVAA